MTPSPPADESDPLATSWTLLEEARNSLLQRERCLQARGLLILRYEHVILRYLRKVLRQDEDAVEECFQRFSVLVLDGGLKGVDPQRGRFRPYLWGCLRHLVTNYHRERQRQLPNLPDPDLLVGDEGYREDYRDGVAARALRALEREEQQTHRVLYSVLRLKMDHSDWHAPQLAEHLSAQRGQSLSAVWVRQRLFQARKRFCQLLRQEVRLDLQQPTAEAIDAELTELGLLHYCRPKPPPEAPAP